MDSFLAAAIAEARQGMREGGIPIGSVMVHGGKIIGRGHNRRVQKASAILHAEMDALENAGRRQARSIGSPCSTPRCRRARCVPAPFCCTEFRAW